MCPHQLGTWSFFLSLGPYPWELASLLASSIVLIHDISISPPSHGGCDYSPLVSSPSQCLAPRRGIYAVPTVCQELLPHLLVGRNKYFHFIGEETEALAPAWSPKWQS